MVTESAHAFGLPVRAELPLAGLHRGGDALGAPLRVALAPAGELAGLWSGPAGPTWGTRLPDGCGYRLDRGRAGDHRLAYGDRATFLLDAPALTLRCAPADPGAPAWRRFLLDTGLALASLARGYEALHAGAVVAGGAAVAILGASGAGKSSLLAALMRRGHGLLADDVLALRRDGAGGVVAHAGPALMNVGHAAASPPPPGRVLADFGDEAWMRVDGAVASAAPLRAVVMLERAAGHGRSELTRLPGSPLALLPHGLGVRFFADRAAERFALYGDLAGSAALLRLRSGLAASPDALAEVLDAVLRPVAVAA